MAIRKTKPGATDGITYKDGAGTEEHDGIDYEQEHRSFDELATGGRVMERHHEEREHEKKDGHRKERASGGSVKSGRSDEQGEEGTGKPEFFGGAESPSAKAAKGDREAAKGGRIKKMRRKERKAGGRVEGKDGHKRLDRAGHGGMKRRAMGGRMAGSDTHPLTEANKLTRPKGDKVTAQDDSESD